MKRKVVSYYPYVGSKLNDEVFKNKNSWEYHLKELLDKENIDIHTHDLVPIEEADYVLVFDNLFYQNIDIMWDIYNNKKCENSVYINYEPVTGHAKNHDEVGMKKLSKIFNRIVTFDDDLVDDKKYIKGNIANFFSKEQPYKNDFNERKFLTMITNNTSSDSVIHLLNKYNHTNYYSKNNIKEDSHSIYSEREKAADFFRRKCKKDFDLYGELWSSKFNSVLKGIVEREDKINVLSKYKFVISYDSYTNQNGYISEKIFDCFMAKTVPVYLGADNVCDYIPKDCFINKKDFNTYDELYEFLRSIDEATYEKYIRNIEKFLQSNNYKKYFSSESSARSLKRALLSGGKISYKDAHDSLMYFEKKRQEVYKNNVITYMFEHINHQENTFTVCFEFRKDAKVKVISDGLDEDITIEFKGKTKRSIVFKPNKKYTTIKVLDMNTNKYINFRSFDPDTTNEYGLLPKKDKLIYYNYVNRSPFYKMFYIFVHNRNKIIKMFKRGDK